MAMSDLGSTLFTLLIFVGLFILAYCAITKKTLTDLFKEIKDMIIAKKVIYAILSGCNVIFSLFVPIAIVLLWLMEFGSKGLGSSIIILLGCFTVIYRSIEYLTIKEEQY
jgi:hypothetical protein